MMDEAIKDFDKVVELDPQDAKAHYNRGLIYFAKGEYRRALEDLKEAVRLDPGFADARRWLKKTERILGK
jgi:tetratricopeptide (TPR) repeat protein